MAAALLTPASLAVIVAAFPDRERAPAIGTWLAWGTVGTVVGPLAGGAIVDDLDWRWVFGLNVPLVLATLLLVRAGIARGEHGHGRRVDYTGAALAAIGLGGVVYALIEQPVNGWAQPATLRVRSSVASRRSPLFVAWERHAAKPMLQLDLFRQRNFTVGNIQTLSMYGGLGTALLLPRDLPAAGRGLHRARGGPRDRCRRR